MKAPFVYLSNGKKHYFWDIISGNPEEITKFHTATELMELRDNKSKNMFNDNTDLWDHPANEYVLAELQDPKLNSLTFQNQDIKNRYLKENDLIQLRDYQVEAVNAVLDSAKNGAHRFLLVMATGTGKTLTCAGLIAAFLQTKNARRVLFLVDRIELETQALRAFNKSFKTGEIYTTQIFKDDREGWNKADILISTVQSLCINDRYLEMFSPADFDLVVVDEAHRTISGTARNLFEYFVGYKIGLTATPKDYFRGINDEKVKYNSQFEYEERTLRDTYITFGCTPGYPTYGFTLRDGVMKHILVNPFAIDARTKMTVELLSKSGFKVKVDENSTDEEREQSIEKAFKRKHYEKTLFSEETNISFCRAFIENAKCDPISGEVGKTIIYCVSQDHAAKITNILNKLADNEYFPKRYNSDFALQVTSLAINPNENTISFNDEKNSLNGKSNVLEDYDTCKTRVCVTVAMMTTGYDCKDLLNIVLMRPIMSPSEFIQIKGRGTRIFDFTYKDKTIQKDNFYLFDYFAVCEYFETNFDYDKPIKVVIPGGESGGGKSHPKVKDVVLNDLDPMSHVIGAQVEEEGMRIDNEYYAIGDLKKVMLEDEELKKAVHKKDWDAVVRIVEEKYADNPKFKNISIGTISKQLELERIATWREFVELVFGIKSHIKSHSELLEDAVQKCMKTFSISELKRKEIRKFIEAYLKSNIVREAIDSKQYSKLDTTGLFTFDEFKSLGTEGKVVAEKIRTILPEELLREVA